MLALKKIKRACLCALVAPLLLTNCSLLALESLDYSFFSKEDVNLVQINYVAADYLIGQARDTVNSNSLVLVSPLTLAQNPHVISPFGDLISEQVGARMAQLGYNVRPVPRDDDLSRRKHHVLLSGTYMPTKADVSVSLRLTDSQTGRIIGAYDYSLPITEEIDELLEPQPMVIRTTRN